MRMKGNRRLIVILVFGMLVLASVQVVGAAGEVIWYWKDVNVSGFSYPSGHQFDKFMNTSEAPQGDANYTVTLGKGERAWWYANYPAECNVTFPKGKWTTTFWVNATNSTDNEKVITVRVWGIYANGSDCWARHTSPKTHNAGYIEKIETKPSPDWPSYTVPVGGRIAVEVLWYSEANGSLVVYCNSITYNSSLTSPPNSPAYPVPELSTLFLFSTGLITLAGYVLLTRRRK
ncbi:MAG: hypothetical protein WBC40_10560 [Halobacteriota archaeon]